ncbi:MAG: hypothetical protein Ct9H300mP22_7120 [Gammaproteobacteria bacterium]|nr:MAG: hypothetical protein Ct9H300mP22_7120 [Gammaproteobacteria bacterium]
MGGTQTEQLKQNQEQLTEIDLIVAGQFQSFSDGVGLPMLNGQT